MLTEGPDSVWIVYGVIVDTDRVAGSGIDSGCLGKRRSVYSDKGGG